MEITLKGIIYFSLSVTMLAIILFFYFYIKEVINYQPSESIGEVCPDEIKKAMMKMGPKYDYLMKGEELYVDRGDGKWLRLRYERR